MTNSTATIFQTRILLGKKVHVIDAEDFSSELISYINDHLVEICEGDTGGNLETVKKYVKGFIKPKDETTQMGATAEFFVHLYLKKLGFKQLFTFLNLEERSIKKGFDGYYSKGKETWIMESKSGSSNTQNISHPSKIKDAYDDLLQKFRGSVTNNPWRNAFNHASNINVGATRNIRDKIKKLSDNFINSIYPSIDDYNIIAASTIFLNDKWVELDVSGFERKMSSTIQNIKCNELFIICVNKKSLKLFLDYLES